MAKTGYIELPAGFFWVNDDTCMHSLSVVTIERIDGERTRVVSDKDTWDVYAPFSEVLSRITAAQQDWQEHLKT